MEEELQNKHRQWLKQFERRRFTIGATPNNFEEWIHDYQDSKYDPRINNIEIGKNKFVIEFDSSSKINPNKECTKEQINKWLDETAENLEKDNTGYERFSHNGVSDHIHGDLNRDASKEEKEAIIRYYTPKESWEFLDSALCSEKHLIAVAYCPHWKHGTIKDLVKRYSGRPVDVGDDKYKEFLKEDTKQQTIQHFSNSGITSEIVKNVKISDLAMQYGARKGKGTTNYHCNFHDDKHPSLSLDDKRGFFKCHADSCGKEGNIVDFVAEAEHISKEEAVKKLIEKAGISSNKPDSISESNKLKDIKNKINNLIINESNKKSEIHKVLKEIISLDDLETEDLLEELHKKTNYKVAVLKKILNKYRKREKENRKITEKLKRNIKHYDRSELKRVVTMLLLQGEMQQATEILCQEIQEKEHIHTTRDDEKSEVWIYQEGIYIPNGKTYIKEFCRLVLEESYSAYLANLVISKIEVDTYIEAKEFFKESPVEEIPVKNGILNIFTKTLSPFTPEKRFFTKIPINRIPLADCPLVKKFLNQIHKHEEDTIIIQECFGYCLLRDYRIEKAIMLTGDGRNGKGRELEVLKRFLGPENCVNIQLQDVEKDNFALSELHGKLANISGDISKEAIANSGNFKMITGMDMITANRKFKIRISFLNYAKQIYSANEIPQTYDLTDAFFSRWVLLEYPFKFVSQKELDKLSEEEKSIKVNGRPRYNLADKEIVSKITTDEELSGVLNWALEGLSRLLQQRDFSYSKSMAEVKDLWIRKSDSFQAFCMDEIEQQYNGFITKEELRQRYSDYCKIHNVTAVGDKAIKETLNRKYGVTDSQRTVYINNNLSDKKVSYIWEGIKFKDDKTTQN